MLATLSTGTVCSNVRTEILQDHHIESTRIAMNSNNASSGCRHGLHRLGTLLVEALAGPVAGTRSGFQFMYRVNKALNSIKH